MGITVYIVSSSDYDGAQIILGIFSSQYSAKQYVADYLKSDSSARAINVEIDEFELDKGVK